MEKETPEADDYMAGSRTFKVEEIEVFKLSRAINELKND
jgi:hypothetical protein